jgi:hypothetical protein
MRTTRKVGIGIGIKVFIRIVGVEADGEGV